MQIFLIKEHFNPDPLHLINLIIMRFFQKHHHVLEMSSKSAFAAAEQRQVWRGLKVVWTVWKVLLVTTETASGLICRNKCAEGLKVAYIEQKCSETI